MVVQNRIQTPDLLKGFAVISMIQVHLMELFARQEIYDSITGKISLFFGGVPAAPVFMIVMGYFLAFGQKQPIRMIIRGVKLFMAGLILNIGLNALLIYKAVYEGLQINLMHYIFGVDILHLAGLSLVTIGLLGYIFKRNFIPYLITAIGVVLISSFIPAYSTENNLGTYLIAFIHSNSDWSYFPLIPWLAYPLIGYSFKTFEENYLKDKLGLKIKIGLAAGFLILILFTISYAAGISHKLDIYYHHDIVFFLWSVSFVILWTILLSFIEKAAGNTSIFKYVKWLGVNVTTVYVIQWLVIGNIATSIYKSQGLIAISLWFIGITIITSLLTYFWNKIKTIVI